MFVHTDKDVEAVTALLDLGLSDYEVARRTGVSRGTVQRWRRDGRPMRRSAGRRFVCDPEAYPYVLGLYLGDGHVDDHRHGSPLLRITNDSRYPRLVESAANALGIVFPDSNVGRYRFPAAGKTVLQVCSPSVLLAFPQHGRGKKHERRIVLEDWQRELTEACPEQFLRGLIESDGCRSINRVKTAGGVYEYPRYYFTNYSADIRELFREHCALLGIRATQSNFKTISVANRKGVAILDSFVGPKS